MKALTAIDLCAGAGGRACAARELPIRVVAAFELATDCAATYQLNHPSTEVLCCDVRDQDFSRWADGSIDIVLGGIPCEEVSAPRRMYPTPPAEMATWHQLIDACLAAVALIEPRFWCMEDVIGLRKHLPPLTPYCVLDAAHWSAQRRKRVYVGSFPRPPRRDGAEEMLLKDHLRRGPWRVSPGILKRQPSRSRIPAGEVFYPWLPDLKAPTVLGFTSRHDNYGAIVDRERRRQPEWQETASLQGFPDDYVFVGSPTRVMKMVGQAVQIDLARAILTEMVLEASAQ